MHGELRDEGGVQTERFWEEYYGRREKVWSGWVNPALVDVVGALPAGTVLDLGCGEGGDAVWLAERGWRVTAVDVSPTALERAAEAAADAGVADRIAFRRLDLARAFPAGSFDLVSAQYLHSPVEFPRGRVLRAAGAAVEPGGLLLVVGHGPVRSDQAEKRGPHMRFQTHEEVLADLDLKSEKWRIERSDSPERQAEGPDGQALTIADVVVAVRRLTG